jgi:hypothetical protein
VSLSRSHSFPSLTTFSYPYFIPYLSIVLRLCQWCIHCIYLCLSLSLYPVLAAAPCMPQLARTCLDEAESLFSLNTMDALPLAWSVPPLPAAADNNEIDVDANSQTYPLALPIAAPHAAPTLRFAAMRVHRRRRRESLRPNSFPPHAVLARQPPPNWASLHLCVATLVFAPFPYLPASARIFLLTCDCSIRMNCCFPVFRTRRQTRVAVRRDRAQPAAARRTPILPARVSDRRLAARAARHVCSTIGTVDGFRLGFLFGFCSSRAT